MGQKPGLLDLSSTCSGLILEATPMSGTSVFAFIMVSPICRIQELKLCMTPAIACSPTTPSIMTAVKRQRSCWVTSSADMLMVYVCRYT